MIKVLIIIVLKHNLGVDLRQILGHRSGGSTQVDSIFFNDQNDLVLTNFKKKNQGVFYPGFTLSQPRFLIR
jgi:hypothetical protein